MARFLNELKSKLFYAICFKKFFSPRLYKNSVKIFCAKFKNDQLFIITAVKAREKCFKKFWMSAF